VRRLIEDETIRVKIPKHAQIESVKDGIDQYLLYVLMTGEIIEDYPERRRVLLLAFAAEEKIPVHIILEYFEGDDFATIVSAYIPDDQHWEKNYKKRKRSRRKK